jgi:hypothetical protein
VRGRLLLITADGTFGFSGDEDPFLQKEAANLHSILSKQPPEETHLLWGMACPNEGGYWAANPPKLQNLYRVDAEKHLSGLGI